MFIPFLTILERRRGEKYEGRKEKELNYFGLLTQQLWTTKPNNFEQPKSNYDNLYI